MAEELDLQIALAELGDRALIEYGNIHGDLWAVTVLNGRAHLHELGPLERIQADIDAVEFALHRLNRVQGSPASREAARATIRDAGQHLQTILLPARLLDGDQALVIVPTGRLHGLAWGALPALDPRPTVVAPSLFGWAVAHRGAVVPRPDSTTLIGGPDLDRRRPSWPRSPGFTPTPLSSTPRPRSPIDASTHSARSRSPTLRATARSAATTRSFPSLRVADGDLTVYDLERCRHLPQTMVLSACNGPRRRCCGEGRCSGCRRR